MTKSIAQQRNRLLEFSKNMSADEIVEWNDMVQDPEIETADVEKFVSDIRDKYRSA